MAFKTATRSGPSPALTSARNQMEAMRRRFAAVRRASKSGTTNEIVGFLEAGGGGALGGVLEGKFGDKLKIGPVGPAAILGLAAGGIAFIAPKAIRCHLLNVGSGSFAYALGKMTNDAVTD